MPSNVRQLKYHRIQKEMNALVADSSPGSKLPSDRELARIYSCNPLTVRKALEPFVEKGLIVRRLGSGTFIPEGAPQTSLKKDLKRIGMMVCAESDAYAMALVKSLHEAAALKSVSLELVWIGDFQRDALKKAGEMAKEGCSALMIPWFPVEGNALVADFVRKSPLPVALATLIPGLEANCFERPEFYGSGTLRLTEGLCLYFRELGHRRIAFLGPDQPSDITMQRMLGAYSSFTCREGMENVCGLVGKNSAGMDALARRWAAFRGGLAVVSYDDSHAIRFMSSMHKLGLRAPSDFAITGCNDSEEALCSDPPLSSLRQNYKYAAERLLSSSLALAAGSSDQTPEALNYHLVVRGSCGGALRPLSAFSRRTLEEAGMELETE